MDIDKDADALGKLFLFRSKTDSLSFTEFKTFKQRFCEEIDDKTFLQIIFDGLHKSNNLMNINNTIEIVEHIIESRESETETESNDHTTATLNNHTKATINDLPQQIIQYIGTYLSLKHLLNFEKTNRFIAQSVRSPSAVKYLIDQDHLFLFKWLDFKVPFNRSIKIGAEDVIFVGVDECKQLI